MREGREDARTPVGAPGAVAQLAARIWTVLPRRLVASFSPRELVVGALLSVAYLLAHSWALVPHFGEDDGARLASDAVRWHLSGVIRLESTDYRMRTSPLYVHALKRAMDAGLSIGSLPRFMSWVSVLLGLVAILALYVLFRRLTGTWIATAACVLFAVTPAGWLAADYGMAHGPALAFWVLALATLPVQWEGRSARALAWRFALTIGLVFVALALKADLVLTGLAFPGMVCVQRGWRVHFAAAACAVVLAGLSAQMVYARSVVSAPLAGAAAVAPVAESEARYAEQWQKRNRFDREAILIPENRRAMTNSMGPFWFALALAALVCHLASGWGSRLGLWALAWACPLILFWGLMAGNSARHSLAALPPLTLLIASLAHRLVETWQRATALLGLLFVPNYYSDTQGSLTGYGTMVPRTDLYQLSVSHRLFSGRSRDAAREFARRPDAKKAAVERFFLVYDELAFAAEAEKRGRLTYDGETYRLTMPGGQVQLAQFRYARGDLAARALSRGLKADGFMVWSHEYGRL